MNGLTFTATNDEEFMAYYREDFPQATVTPKLHILDTYRTMPDKLKRLKHLMEAHYLHIAPENIALRPPLKAL